MELHLLARPTIRALILGATGGGAGFLWSRLLVPGAPVHDLMVIGALILGAASLLVGDREFRRNRGLPQRLAVGYLALALPGHVLFPVAVFAPAGTATATGVVAGSAALLLIVAMVVLSVRWDLALRRGLLPAVESRCASRSAVSRILWLGIAIGSLGPLVLLADLGPVPFSPHLLFLVPAGAAGWATGRWGGVIMAWVAVVAYTWSRRDLVEAPVQGFSLPLDAEAGWLLADALLLGVGLTVGGWVVAEIRDRRSAGGWCRTDPLTGLLDRQSFLADAGLELGRARRYARPITLALVDVDGFREVNEALGPQAGDRILRGVGQSLRGRFRRLDRLARVGPDQFAIFLPETDLGQARIVLASLRKQIREQVRVRGEPLSLTIGAVSGSPDSPDARPLLNQAESAIRKARERDDGRGLHLEPLRGSEPTSDRTPALTRPTSAPWPPSPGPAQEHRVRSHSRKPVPPAS